MKTEIVFLRDIFLVLLCQLACADHYNMLQVVSLCTETSEHQPHESVFCRQKKDHCNVEDQNDATGEVDQAKNEKQGRRNQCGNGHAQDNGSDFPDQSPCTGSIIETENGKDEEEHQ